MLIVDTGFLVALYIRRDKLHPYAVKFLQQNQQPLITAAPVIVESCYFLDAKAKIALLDWVLRGGLSVIDVPVAAYEEIAQTMILILPMRQWFGWLTTTKSNKS
jgi:predicted nucleic acid-binding protein